VCGRSTHREKGFHRLAGAIIPVHDAVTARSGRVSVRDGAGRELPQPMRKPHATKQLTAGSAATCTPSSTMGVPRLCADHLRTGVSSACRYDPDLNPTTKSWPCITAWAWCRHVLSARDKAKVEVGVQVVERWIIAACVTGKFFPLEEVNRAVRELLERLNQRPFRSARIACHMFARWNASACGRCPPNGST